MKYDYLVVDTGGSPTRRKKLSSGSGEIPDKIGVDKEGPDGQSQKTTSLEKLTDQYAKS